MYLLEPPTPEDYYEKHKVSDRWESSGKYAHNAPQKYWSGKIRQKTPEQIEKKNRIKQIEEWKK